MLAVFAVDIATGDTNANPCLRCCRHRMPSTDAAAKVLASGEFKATLGEALLLHAPAGLKAERLLLVGLGKSKSLSIHEIRKGAGAAVRAAKPRNLRDMAIVFPEDYALSDEHLDSLPCLLMSRALIEGALLADGDYDTYKSDRKDTSLKSLSVIAKQTEKSTQAEIQQGFDEGTDRSRRAELHPLPRQRARQQAHPHRPRPARRGDVRRDRPQVRGLLHRQAARAEDGRLLERLPGLRRTSSPHRHDATSRRKASTARRPVLGLVGKGITFDTGGISIKPADNMEKMKYDMAGGAAMIGAMRAIALLKPKVRVIGIVCSAENMPDGKASEARRRRQTAMSGKTIEIINTDAEGRLVLADGLTTPRPSAAPTSSTPPPSPEPASSPWA